MTWANAVNVAVSGNSIQKTAGGSAWNAGAVSSMQLSAGNGAAQIRVDGAGGYRLFGLATSDVDQGYTSMRYVMDLEANGTLYVLESGVNRGQVGVYGVGELLKIEVSGRGGALLEAGGGQRDVDCAVHQQCGAGVSAAAGHVDLYSRGLGAERLLRCRDVPLRELRTSNCEMWRAERLSAGTVQNRCKVALYVVQRTRGGGVEGDGSARVSKSS